MLKLATYSLLLLSLNLNATTSENVEIKYSNQGYPYKLLINRADTIKILFTEDTQSVNCAVEFKRGKISEKSVYVEVDTKDFESQPLASCLPRKQAKLWLKQTF
ncbi:hypothetical protein [Aliiglaciecola lipolytica]|uniref:Uncharacterized protein n=1 Tax=Aliiglaciecola lipolytica E3 TaxID=1127673 RepID=K6X0B6_9ALTE|nr:hypothetical protein [Aliiglaciecola lipolytica]GAC14119.1 hypothetical protein GLIP_1484 [Aliiglaciecola lipolytica E3]